MQGSRTVLLKEIFRLYDEAKTLGHMLNLDVFSIV